MNKKVVAALALSAAVLVAGAASANTMYFKTRPTISGKVVAHGGSPAVAKAGMEILLQGGTAFDAAMAMAAAQSYSEVMMCHIFGGDLQLIGYDAKAKKVFSFNGTGWAPKKATIDFHMDKTNAEIPVKGIYSMHMPGEWSGWMTFLGKYGTMPLSKILAPAVDMAKNGIITDDFLANMIEKYSGPMNDEAKSVFWPNGKALKAGDLYVNPGYADLLETMGKVADKAAEGKTVADGYKAAEDYFYRGPIAEEIVKWNNENGGDFSIEDFNEFHAEEISFTNPLYQHFYQEYARLAQQFDSQDDLCKAFAQHDDEALQALAIPILTEQTPDCSPAWEQRFDMDTPRPDTDIECLNQEITGCVNLFKMRLIDKCKELLIKELESGDLTEQEQRDIMMRIGELNERAKELGNLQRIVISSQY